MKLPKIKLPGAGIGALKGPGKIAAQEAKAARSAARAADKLKREEIGKIVQSHSTPQTTHAHINDRGEIVRPGLESMPNAGHSVSPSINERGEIIRPSLENVSNAGHSASSSINECGEIIREGWVARTNEGTHQAVAKPNKPKKQPKVATGQNDAPQSGTTANEAEARKKVMEALVNPQTGRGLV